MIAFERSHPQTTAPRRLPQLSSQRRQQQDKVITGLMRQNPALTREQIAEARKRLDAMPGAEFQKARAGSQSQLTATPARIQQSRKEYYEQALLKQIGQEVAGGLARLGESAQRGANRFIRPMAEAVGLGDAIQRGREAEEATAQKLAEEETIANSLRSKVVRGLTQGAGGATMMAPVAMAGGIPAVMGATGLQQDWERDPLGSAVNTATAGLPIVAGRAVSPFAQRAAQGGRPGLQKAAQLAIEGGAGSAANVGQYAGTQALLGREIDPEEAITQGIVGAGLSGAMAPRLGARTRPAPLSAPPERAGASRQDYAARVEPAMLAREYVRQVEEINRSVADPQAKQVALDQTRAEYQAARRAPRPTQEAQPLAVEPTRPSYLTGQDKKTALGSFGVPARIAAQFSPANISTYAPQPVAREISRLNDAGEKVSVALPRPLGEKETGKRGYREPTTLLRSRERQFAEAFASTSRELIKHPDYKSADNAVKALAFGNLAKYLRERTRKELDERTIEGIIEGAANAVERRQTRLQEK